MSHQLVPLLSFPAVTNVALNKLKTEITELSDELIATQTIFEKREGVIVAAMVSH